MNSKWIMSLRIWLLLSISNTIMHVMQNWVYILPNTYIFSDVSDRQPKIWTWVTIRKYQILSWSVCTFFSMSLSLKVNFKDLRWSFFILLLLAISIEISIKLSNSSARETLVFSEASVGWPPFPWAPAVEASSSQISSWKINRNSY